MAGLVLEPSSVSESGGVSAVSATLSGASSEAVTLTVVAAAGPGAAAEDFTQTGTTLTLAAGATTSTGTVTVTANGNDVDTPDKTVTVSATAAGGNGVASPRDVTLTLIDDDVVADLATGRGSIAYAKETLTATLDSGGVTYYVVSSPPAPGRWSMTAPAGRAAAGGSTLQVRFVLGDMVFAGADAPTLSAPGRLEHPALGRPRVRGGRGRPRGALQRRGSHRALHRFRCGDGLDGEVPRGTSGPGGDGPGGDEAWGRAAPSHRAIRSPWSGWRAG